MKKTPAIILFLISLTMWAESAHAGAYTLSDNAQLVAGCSGTIEILIDTEGANVIASDTTLTFSANEATVNSLNIGTPLPMQAFNQINPNEIKLSGARLPFSGAFNATGVFGYINFTPKANATSVTFDFKPDFQIENNMVNENIQNVLTSAAGKTYSVAGRYNVEVDGVGFCTPDVTKPTIQLISPQDNSANNAVDSNVIFTLTDDRAGIDLNSLSFTVNGISYNQNSAQVNILPDGNLFRIETNPDTNFEEGASVPVSITVCDKNTPANCKTGNYNFFIFSPAPPPPVCGNGILEPNGGEQCDDGNVTSGDGCSGLCLTEGAPPPLTPSCNDGLYSPGEEGVDCGGVCNTPCATCVDGIANQGEQGVDCGGPCQPCDVICQPAYEEELKPSAPEKKLTICHRPEENPENKYNLEISENSWESHKKHGDEKGPCKAEKEAVQKDESSLSKLITGSITDAIKQPEPQPEPLPKEYSVNITTNNCDAKAPFQSVEILQPENNILSSDLTPEIYGSVTKNTEKVVIWRTKLDKNGKRSNGESRTRIDEVNNFSNYPEVNGCNIASAYKNFALKNYEAFEDDSNYVVEAEAYYSETSNNGDAVNRSIISAINIAFNTGLFPKPPTELTLNGKVVPKNSITTDEKGNKVVLLDSTWLKSAKADDGNPYNFEIKNSQPEIGGKTSPNARVFAIWNSNVVLNGNTVSDNESGKFNITAPRPLKTNTEHTVNVYAVKTNSANKKVRSPGVTVYFEIKDESLLATMVMVATFSLLLLLLITFRRQIYKKLFIGLKLLNKKEKIAKAKKISEKLFK